MIPIQPLHFFYFLSKQPPSLIAHSSPYFASSRRSQVLPAGAAGTSDDVWALQRLDPGLQVSISSCWMSGGSVPFSLSFILEVLSFPSKHPTYLLCPSAAFKIKTRDCRHCWTPVRNCPRPTTTTLSESSFPCYPLLGPSLFRNCGALFSGWFKLSWWGLL